MTNINNQVERELGWDDTIEKESSFVLLPDGDYTFTVDKFERARYTPSATSKVPACNMAKLEITLHGGDLGDTKVFHNLYLHSKMEGLLSAFFIAIGQKKKGEPLQMNWNNVIGATGKAKVKINKYTGNDGKSRENNQIDRFYEPTNYNQATQQQPMQPQQGGYTAGQF